MRPIVLLALFALSSAAQTAPAKLTAPQLLELAKNPQAPAYAGALEATLGADHLKKGDAAIGEGSDFVFAVEADAKPVLYIDDQRAAELQATANPRLWAGTAKLTPGTSHYFHYLAGGAKIGGRNDLAVFGPESYAQPGVPQGKLSPKMTAVSKIYDGMTTDYWIYTPAQYEARTPAALMVWQDGHNFIDRDRTKYQNVIDNLTARKEIPVMISVFIDPGKIGDKAMRSIEYDTVNDKYVRFVRDEILAEVEKHFNIRKDAYSRAIGGESSGGICAFNAAWFAPDQYSRVLSRIGSFTSIQWRPGEIDGGNVYPFKIRKEAKRNIRVWLQDGSEDLENEHGSWPLQNLQMANSLKRMNYDFHLSFGTGTHSTSQGNAQLPEAMTWLWRGYDPARTEQTYEIDPAERTLPPFRVKVYNR